MVVPTRLSAEFRAELSAPLRRRYPHRSIAEAKNIGPIKVYH